MWPLGYLAGAQGTPFGESQVEGDRGDAQVGLGEGFAPDSSRARRLP